MNLDASLEQLALILVLGALGIIAALRGEWPTVGVIIGVAGGGLNLQRKPGQVPTDPQS